MKDLQKYWPILCIAAFAVIVTVIAVWRTAVNPQLNQQDSWGFYFWVTPVAYLALLAFFLHTLGKGISVLNRPISVIIATLVYGLSAMLLFVPTLPAGLQWHYPMGVAALAVFFLSTYV